MRGRNFSLQHGLRKHLKPTLRETEGPLGGIGEAKRGWEGFEGFLGKIWGAGEGSGDWFWVS